MAPSILLIRDVVNNTQSLNGTSAQGNSTKEFGDWRHNATPIVFIIESWSEGYMLGSLIIMACITISNMRRGVFLHKLILIELLLAMLHGTFCFMNFKGYGWYLSATAAPLYWSYFTHNVVAWLKIKPFFTAPSSAFRPKTCKWVTWVFLTTLVLTIPITIFQVINNFRFFNQISTMYTLARPFESTFRDPWWLFSVFVLFHVIRTSYKFPVLQLIKISPRFGILLCAIFLSMTFTCLDILSIIVPKLSGTAGINPYWKLALVFKCLTDNIMLDDFKTTLKKLGALKLQAAGGPQPNDGASSSLNKSAAAAEKVSPWSHLNSSDRRTSMSGRTLEPYEELDPSGRGRRKSSLAALGRVGKKLHNLPGLPPSSIPLWRRSTTTVTTQPIKEDTPLTGNMTVISSVAPDERPGTEEPHAIHMTTVISSKELKDGSSTESNDYVPMGIYPGDSRVASSGSSHITLVSKVGRRSVI